MEFKNKSVLFKTRQNKTEIHSFVKMHTSHEHFEDLPYN